MSRPSSSVTYAHRPSPGPESMGSSIPAPTSPQSTSRSREYAKSGIANTSVQEILDNVSSHRRKSSASTSSGVRHSESLLMDDSATDGRWSLTQTSRSSKHGHHRSRSYGQRLSLGVAPLNINNNSMRRSVSPSKQTQLSGSSSRPSKGERPMHAPIAPAEAISSAENSFQIDESLEQNLTSNDTTASSQPAQSTETSYSTRYGYERPVASSPSRSSSPRKRKSSEDESQQTSSNSRAYSLQSSPGDSQTMSPSDSAPTSRHDSAEWKTSKREYSPRKQARRSNDGNSRRSSQQRSSDPSKKSRRDKEQKALSKALQKAHEAVAFDNAQNYSEAIKLYEDACSLLLAIMSRSSDRDREKLEPVRTRYAARVEELRTVELEPDYSHSRENLSQSSTSNGGGQINPQSFGNSAVGGEGSSRIDDSSLSQTTEAGSKEGPGQSFSTDISTSFASTATTTTTESHDSDSTPLQPLFSGRPGPSSQRPNAADRGFNTPATLLPPNHDVIPRPLSPRRGAESETPVKESRADEQTVKKSKQRRRSNVSNDSVTWLGHAKPSGGSSQSSVHSVSSINGIQRKHLRTGSGDTEAEFDAALDAAVEAAYGEGYELFEDQDDSAAREDTPKSSKTEPSISRDFDVPLDREAVISAAKAREAERRRNQRPFHLTELEFSPAGDSDEEERLLDEVTSNFIADDPLTNPPPKSFLPRQSDSSTSSGRTWGSSVASSLNTTGTSLSTVEENSSAHQSPNSKHPPPPLPPKMPTAAPPAPPPKDALPAIPAPLLPASLVSPENQPLGFKPPPSLSGLASPSVQDRRGSGQRTKKLKIETAIPSRNHQTQNVEPPATTGALGRGAMPKELPSTSTTSVSSDSKAYENDSKIKQTTLSPIKTQFITSPFPSPFPGALSTQPSTEFSPPTPSLTSAFSNESSIRPSPQSPGNLLSSNRSPLKQDPSMLSVKKQHLLPTPTADSFDTSPASPMSFAFNSSPGRRVPMNTPVTGLFAPNLRQASNSTTHLFENDIHNSHSPNTPRDRVYNSPKALEPCPESFLLRPFWLMRCIQQTLTNPRGGYLSTKIFVPREVWKAKNVKLKGVEEKIANCDLLTAALLKLSSTDTLDADTVLEEMQAFELVMDQAQTNLNKKIGAEVGVSTVSTLFKDAPPSSASPSTSADNGFQSGGDATNSKSSSKGYLSSWRKLRSKNSSANIAGQNHGHLKEPTKEIMIMGSVPMTSVIDNTSSRQSRRDATARAEVKYEGPNSQYMSALAKLCDAVQVLDQIARQVEDPGLKHSSQTHVGLELSTRHAAEFFGFYICRFILQDITLLAEKFVKRATEWVLS